MLEGMIAKQNGFSNKQPGNSDNRKKRAFVGHQMGQADVGCPL